MSIRVALIDDDRDIHELVGDLLRTTGEFIFAGQAYRGSDALALCRTAQPDIILMDVKMPGLSGAEATRAVLDEFPGIKILAMSSYRDYEDIKAILDSGAVGYIVKGSEGDDLLNTIRLVYQGKAVLTPEVMQVLVSPPDPAMDESLLTGRELDVLRLMGQGQTNGEVAASLGITARTVSFHVENILKKLEVSTRSEALVLAARNKLL